MILIEHVRSNLDPDTPFPTDTVGFSGTLFAEFQLVTEPCVKTVLQQMPANLVTSTQHQPLSLMAGWMEMIS